MLTTRRSRQTALSAAVTLALLSVPGFSQAAELLQNNGFELPTTTSGEDSVATGWTFGGTIERANFANHTTGGSRSVWMRTFENAGSVTQSASVVPNTSYTLSDFEYFQDNYQSLTSANINLQLQWLDSGGNAIGSPLLNQVTPNTPGLTVDTWLPYSLTATAPANAVSAQVSVGWNNGAGSGPALSVFADDVSLQGAALANSEWASATSGDWNVNSNWKNLTVPNAIGAEADFYSAITSAQTVYTNSAVTVGSMNFNNTNKYVITGAGSITLQTASGNAQINVTTGTQEVNLPLTIASNTTLNVASGAQLIIADPVTVASGKTLTPTGTGSVTYQSTVTVQTGGAVAFGSATHALGLTLQGTSTSSVLQHTGSTQTLVNIENLSIASGSSFDLTNNALLTKATPATVRGLLQTGALKTSLTTGGHAIGYADQGGGVTKAQYTIAGDANLDGVVNIGDLGSLATNYGLSSKVWVSGDFNYDGTVNIADLGILATNYGLGSPTPLPLSFQQALSIVEGEVGHAVPEPASMSILMLGSLLTLGRRKRNG